MTEPKSLKVRITFFEEVLGTASNNPNIHSEFIASKAEDAMKMEEEVDAIGVEEYIEKAMTVFPRNKDGKPIMWDYQIKGFFKDSCGVLRKVTGSKCSKVKAYKKEIDGLLFVVERKIPIALSGDVGLCQRPLRTDGPTGSRTALASSETVPAGSTIELTLVLMRDDMAKWVTECLDYGVLRGLGQWRNSGKGRFTWVEVGG